MNHNHYIPDPDKRSDQAGPNPLDALHKMSGVEQEKHHKQVQAIIKGMDLKPEETNDYERLIGESNQRLRNVWQWAQAEVQDAIASAKDTTSGEFRAHIIHGVLDKLVRNYSHYDKDQLVLIISNLMMKNIVREVL